jgi:ABC-type branched-subunit amino acid transport system substrate-binding protein
MHPEGGRRVRSAALRAASVSRASTDQLQAKGVDALFFGGYYAEAALIIRQARSRGYIVRMIGPDP